MHGKRKKLFKKKEQNLFTDERVRESMAPYVDAYFESLKIPPEKYAELIAERLEEGAIGECVRVGNVLYCLFYSKQIFRLSVEEITAEEFQRETDSGGQKLPQ